MKTPTRLVNSQGQVRYGVYEHSVDEVNFMDFDLRTPMDKPRSRLAKRFACNQFQFVCFSSPSLIVGVAIVDLKLVSNAFVYLYEPSSARYQEFSFLQPLAIGTRIGDSPTRGSARFHKGNARLSITAQPESGMRHVEVAIGDQLRIDAQIDESPPCQPKAVCTRAGYNGWVFTHKANALLCTGEIRWQDRPYSLKDMGALASLDWTAGFMRRETFWNWGSLSCYLADGRRLGFNLAAGVNETGFTENALWLDGQRYNVDMVDFQFERYQPDSPWQLRSADGTIDVHFTPKGRRCEKTNAWLMASNFNQYFGQYHGQVIVANEQITLNGEWGLVEDHYARW